MQTAQNPETVLRITVYTVFSLSIPTLDSGSEYASLLKSDVGHFLSVRSLSLISCLDRVEPLLKFYF